MNRLVMLLHPAFLAGFRLGDWLRFLSRNHWRIELMCWPRALIATCASALTSLLSLFEPSPASHSVADPVFILGLARSGTTHLHRLLALHPEFSAPSRLECYNPHTFLLLHRLGVADLANRIPLDSRTIDRVQVGWRTPEEDEYGIFLMTGSDSYRSAVFPRNDPGLSSGLGSPAPPAACLRWQQALETLHGKLAWCHGKRLVLKSPTHTFHIPDILSVFPNARFVTVIRNPITHFQSFRAAFGQAQPAYEGWGSLQNRPAVNDSILLDQLTCQIAKYVADRRLIPAMHLVEIRHEDLVADESGTIAFILESLALPRWESVAHTLHQRREEERLYTRNSHAPLSPDLESRVRAVYEPLQAYAGSYAFDSSRHACHRTEPADKAPPLM
jgi:hypothetical protein